MQRDMMWGEAAFLASGAARGRAAVIDRPQAAAHKLRSRRRSIQRAASTTGLRHRPPAASRDYVSKPTIVRVRKSIT